MKSKIMIWLILATVAYGEKLVVCDGSVDLVINGKAAQMESGNWKLVKPGTSIKLVSGSGSVQIISNRAPYKLSTKGVTKYRVPKAKGFISWSKSQIAKLFGPPKETSTSGICKGGGRGELERNISIEGSAKKIVIHSKKWGPFPIRLLITRGGQSASEYYFDQDSFVKGESKREVFFVVPTKSLQSGDRYQILAGEGKLPKEKIVQRGAFVFGN